MAASVRIRKGLLARLRKVNEIPSEEHQARLMGVDRATLRRVDRGAQPSGAFQAALCVAFGLGLGEAFEIVQDEPLTTAA